MPLAGAAAAAAAEPPRRGRGLFARSVLTDCNHTVGTHHYDLSPLRGVVFTGADTSGKGRGSYNLSVCGDIPTPCRDSLTGMKSPAGLLYTLWDGEPTGTCWPPQPSCWLPRRSGRALRLRPALSRAHSTAHSSAGPGCRRLASRGRVSRAKHQLTARPWRAPAARTTVPVLAHAPSCTASRLTRTTRRRQPSAA